MEINLLKYGSLFLKVVSEDEIEFERQYLEAVHGKKLKVFRQTNETRSGARVTRVEWEVVE